MTAYLVLDLTVNDLRDFLPYVDAIPAFIGKHGGRYASKGADPALGREMLDLRGPGREPAPMESPG